MHPILIAFAMLFTSQPTNSTYLGPVPQLSIYTGPLPCPNDGPPPCKCAPGPNCPTQPPPQIAGENKPFYDWNFKEVIAIV
jgi:hypothetical protein